MLIFYGLLCYVIAQSIAWLQINGQFVSTWCKNHPFLLSITGIPISYFLILATGYIYEALDGKTWPGRLLGFAVGIIIFTLFTNWFLGEAITWKTGVSLLLTIIIILIQIL